MEQKKKQPANTYIHDIFLEQLRKISKEEGIPVKFMINKAVEMYLKNRSVKT